MNEKLIKSIKEVPGVKTVTYIPELGDNTVLVTFEADKKEPILHDEYGVPMYKGDKYWWVETDISINDSYKSLGVFTINWTVEEEKRSPWPETSKIFASKESAERWIEENKPKKPLYIDPVTGDEFYEGDEIFWFLKDTCKICSAHANTSVVFKEYTNTSKAFLNKNKCAIALVSYLIEYDLNKLAEIIIDKQ